MPTQGHGGSEVGRVPAKWTPLRTLCFGLILRKSHRLVQLRKRWGDKDIVFLEDDVLDTFGNGHADIKLKRQIEYNI